MTEESDNIISIFKHSNFKSRLSNCKHQGEEDDLEDYDDIDDEDYNLLLDLLEQDVNTASDMTIKLIADIYSAMNDIIDRKIAMKVLMITHPELPDVYVTISDKAPRYPE